MEHTETPARPSAFKTCIVATLGPCSKVTTNAGARYQEFSAYRSRLNHELQLEEEDLCAER